MQRQSRLTQEKREELLKYFINDVTARSAAEMAEVNRNTVNKWYNTLRGLIAEKYKAPRFEGEVEIDQAFFGHKRRSRKKKKRVKHGLEYGLTPKIKKKKTEDLIQVLGIIERDKKGSRVYAHIIRNSKKDIVIPVVHLVVEGNTTIYTDNHSTFSDLHFSGYKHGVIDKSQRKVFWNHETNGKKVTKTIHTNTIESFFAFAKARLYKFKGIARESYPLHIKETVWRWNNKKDLKSTLNTLIKPQL